MIQKIRHTGLRKPHQDDSAAKVNLATPPAHTCPLGRGFGAAGYGPTRRPASRAEGAADGHVVCEGVGELAGDVPIRGPCATDVDFEDYH